MSILTKHAEEKPVTRFQVSQGMVSLFPGVNTAVQGGRTEPRTQVKNNIASATMCSHQVPCSPGALGAFQISYECTAPEHFLHLQLIIYSLAACGT